MRDDGAVVYLNGTEVFRSNMPTGTITYTTLASTTVGGTDVILAMSPLVAQFGLRFAAVALPAGERPGGLRAERGGMVLENQPHAGPPRRPPGLAG